MNFQMAALTLFMSAAAMAASYTAGHMSGTAKIKAQWDVAVLEAEETAAELEEQAALVTEEVEADVNTEAQGLASVDAQVEAELFAARFEKQQLEQELANAIELAQSDDCFAEPLPASLLDATARQRAYYLDNREASGVGDTADFSGSDDLAGGDAP